MTMLEMLTKLTNEAAELTETMFFDAEFLKSKELADFYTKWKNDKIQARVSEQEKEAKEKRRALFQKLKQEFES